MVLPGREYANRERCVPDDDSKWEFVVFVDFLSLYQVPPYARATQYPVLTFHMALPGSTKKIPGAAYTRKMSDFKA